MKRALVLAAVIGGAAGAADPPAGFDPNDVAKTHTWLVKERAAAPAPPAGNELAAKRVDDAFQKTLDGLTGQAVRWTVTVSGVDREGRVGVQPFGVAPVDDRPAGERAPKGDLPVRRTARNAIRFSNGAAAAERRPGFGGTAVIDSYFPPKKDGEWVAKLATGDKVVLTGTVQSAQVTSASGRAAAGGGGFGPAGLTALTSFTIVLKDGAVEPAPAP
jgi:hypothetical protein